MVQALACCLLLMASRSPTSSRVLGASSAPSVCGITLFTGVVGGGGLAGSAGSGAAAPPEAGSAGSGAAAPPGERAVLRFLLALVSMVLEAAC